MKLRATSASQTPEYLAAVSTPVRDVRRTYGGWERVIIFDSVSAFQSGISLALFNPQGLASDRSQLDHCLREQSWDNTWPQMQHILIGQLTTTARLGRAALHAD